MEPLQPDRQVTSRPRFGCLRANIHDGALRSDDDRLRHPLVPAATFTDVSSWWIVPVGAMAVGAAVAGLATRRTRADGGAIGNDAAAVASLRVEAAALRADAARLRGRVDTGVEGRRGVADGPQDHR